MLVSVNFFNSYLNNMTSERFRSPSLIAHQFQGSMVDPALGLVKDTIKLGEAQEDAGHDSSERCGVPKPAGARGHTHRHLVAV